MVLNWDDFVSQGTLGNIWTTLIVTTEGGLSKLTWQKSTMLLNILQCKGHSATSENYLVQVMPAVQCLKNPHSQNDKLFRVVWLYYYCIIILFSLFGYFQCAFSIFYLLVTSLKMFHALSKGSWPTSTLWPSRPQYLFLWQILGR